MERTKKIHSVDDMDTGASDRFHANLMPPKQYGSFHTKHGNVCCSSSNKGLSADLGLTVTDLLLAAFLAGVFGMGLGGVMITIVNNNINMNINTVLF